MELAMDEAKMLFAGIFDVTCPCPFEVIVDSYTKVLPWGNPKVNC